MKPTYYQKRYRHGLSTGKLFALAAAVFSMALGVSATSTYAWYMISEQFRIGGFDMEIEFNPTFELGRKVNGQITYQDEPYTLKDFGYEKPTLDNISNMSCVGYPAQYDESFTPYFSSGYGSNYAGLTPNAESGFVQLEFYATVNEDAFLYLTPESRGIVNEEANRAAAIKKGVDISVLNNVLNATRLSFYSPLGYVIAEMGEHEEVSYAGLLDLHGTGYYNVDEEGKEFLFGLYDGTPSYSSTALSADVDEFESHDIFHAGHRAGSYTLDMESFTPKKETAHPISDYVYKDGYSRPYPIAAIPANTPTRFVVSVFLEGWDHDMTSLLIDASFGLDLGFVAVFSQEADDFFPKK